MALAADQIVIERPAFFGLGFDDPTIKNCIHIWAPYKDDQFVRWTLLSPDGYWDTYQINYIEIGTPYSAKYIVPDVNDGGVTIGGWLKYTSSNGSIKYWREDSDDQDPFTWQSGADYDYVLLLPWGYATHGSIDISTDGDCTILRPTVDCSSDNGVAYPGLLAQAAIPIASNVSSGETLTLDHATGTGTTRFFGFVGINLTPTDPSVGGCRHLSNILLADVAWAQAAAPDLYKNDCVVQPMDAGITAGITLARTLEGSYWGTAAHTDANNTISNVTADWTVYTEANPEGVAWAPSEDDMDVAQGLKLAISADMTVASTAAGTYEETHLFTPSGYTLRPKLTFNAAAEAASITDGGGYMCMWPLKPDMGIYAWAGPESAPVFLDGSDEAGFIAEAYTNTWLLFGGDLGDVVLRHELHPEAGMIGTVGKVQSIAEVKDKIYPAVDDIAIGDVSDGDVIEGAATYSVLNKRALPDFIKRQGQRYGRLGSLG